MAADNMSDRVLRVLTGAEAVAHAMRQIRPNVVPIYPITPQTPIIQTFSRFVADGLVDTVLLQVESEHSAMSAAVGAALAGGRTVTATASQGLALMIEIVYIASGMRAPITIAVGNRALSGPINIHGDHSDGMLARDSGAVQIFGENAQEAYDLMLMAPRIAEHPDVLLPVLVEQDGFTITHSAEPVQLLEDAAASAFVGAYRIPYPLLDQRRPTTQGVFAMPDSYFEFKHQQAQAIMAAADVFAAVASDYHALTGRDYQAVEAYRMEGAERAIVVMGSAAGTAKEVVDALRAEGEQVGLVEVRLFRPFPYEVMRSVLADAASVAVLDRSSSPGSFPPLFLDVRAALTGKAPDVRSHVYGLGGRDLSPQMLRDVFSALLQPAVRGAISYVGLKEGR